MWQPRPSWRTRIISVFNCVRRTRCVSSQQSYFLFCFLGHFFSQFAIPWGPRGRRYSSLGLMARISCPRTPGQVQRPTETITPSITSSCIARVRRRPPILCLQLSPVENIKPILVHYQPPYDPIDAREITSTQGRESPELRASLGLLPPGLHTTLEKDDEQPSKGSGTCSRRSHSLDNGSRAR